jgi:RNA polymerase sigma factor (sigma-70 family)
MGEFAHADVVWNAAGQPMTAVQPTFDTFFLDERDGLSRALCAITGSRSQAEDIAQEAFLKILERWDTVSVMENPGGYLYRTALNLYRSEYRRATRAMKRLVSREPEDDDVFAPIHDRDEALTALAVLTPRQRAALVLTEGLGYSGEEAAGMLGIKPATIYALTHQARATLATLTEADR